MLLLDKPQHLSSNAALQRAKHLYEAAKAGHTGTLDPLATGLLPLCFGEATKFGEALLQGRKEYVATVRFGIATTTGDAEGEVVRTGTSSFSHEALSSVLPGFTGTITQTPPAYAALKFRGRSYYEYARAGVAIPRAPREIEVDAIELQDWTPPLARLKIACGKGTYIRVLAEDIAAALDTCAHLAALRRTAAGPFAVDGAVTLDALAAMEPSARDALLLPADAPLAHVLRLDVDLVTASALRQGRPARAALVASGKYRCYDPRGQFLGLVEFSSGALRPLRLLRTETPLEH